MRIAKMVMGSRSWRVVFVVNGKNYNIAEAPNQRKGGNFG
jgi:hypothetical protein